jgi:hypothetical protein
MIESLDARLWEFESDGSSELVRTPEPFGISEDSHSLAWGVGSAPAG